MELKVHCPHCHATLRVPLAAAGKHARCPACRTTFIIPTEEDIAEQTVSFWIENDMEELNETQDHQWEDRLKRDAARRAAEEERKRQETAREIEKVLSSTATGMPSLKSSTSSDLPSEASDSSASQTRLESSSSGAGSRTPVSTDSPADSFAGQAVTRDTNNHKSKSKEEYKPLQYPTKPPSPKSMPWLFVQSCTLNGVVFTFDARFLKHDGFRLSMPVMCVFTRETDRAKLLVRPLAFLDQTKGNIHNAYEIESGHEQKMIKGQTRREMLARMGILPDLPDPFRIPLPYYVRQDHSSQSLKCTTSRREDGSVLCHVMIPDGQVAVRWLGHVNGICGPEYDMLRRDVDRLWQDSWMGLDEQVRRRLEIWTQFLPGERFRYFINDADMRKKDEGLAGVVLTDRRLIYKKFHRQGQFEYGTNTRLVVRPDGQFAGLRVKTPDGTFKCAKFHFHDLEKLRDAAQELGFELDVAK